MIGVIQTLNMLLFRLDAVLPSKYKGEVCVVFKFLVFVVLTSNKAYTNRVLAALMDYLYIGNPAKTQIVMEYVFSETLLLVANFYEGPM